MKISVEQQAKGQELLNTIITKAWSDDTFRMELVKNPETALEKMLGTQMTIPAGKKIIVQDQSNPDVIYINIPAKLELDNIELSDEQLEQVAGGIAPLVVLAWIGGAAAGAQIIDWIGQGWNSVN